MPRTTIFTTAADCVAAFSTGLGGLLTIAPRTGGRWLDLPNAATARTRVLGTADLGLGIAIFSGRSRPWRWSVVAARSALHLVFAREYVRNGRRVNAAAMCALFVVDARIAAGLRDP